MNVINSNMDDMIAATESVDQRQLLSRPFDINLDDVRYFDFLADFGVDNLTDEIAQQDTRIGLDKQILSESHTDAIHATNNHNASQPSEQTHQVHPSTAFESSNECYPWYPIPHMRNDGEYEQPQLQQQSNHVETSQIIIHDQPRSQYHPRTLNEYKKSTHFVRCEDDSASKYPKVSVHPEWKDPPLSVNYLEVTLTDINDEPHPNILASKEKKSSDDKLLITRLVEDAHNTLNFLLTDEDFDKGYKMLAFELIKRKQGSDLTKKQIRDRQLEKSKLRITRTFVDGNGVYYRDEASTVYSCIMTENYANVSVKYMNPVYGPMNGNNLLNVSFVGLTKDDKKTLLIRISEQTNNWRYEIKKFDSTGNNISFRMPAFPFPRNDSVMSNVSIYRGEQELYKSSYLYVKGLDEILDTFNLNKPPQVDEESTKSNNGNSSNRGVINILRSSSTVSKQTSKTNSRKRKHTG